jgi:putative flippase GtrA
MRDLVIEKNSLSDKSTSSCFEYFRCIADKVSIRTDEGKKILSDQYDKITFISPNTVLATYLNPDDKFLKGTPSSTIYFPFGCNLSQMQAVTNALSNKISVIEGPPGTGKTQTILNIIANAVINNKTVAVVSNNNSATENVFEKLQSYGFDFIAAPLGKFDNKIEFINNKQSDYPDFNEYKYEADKLDNFRKEIITMIKYGSVGVMNTAVFSGITYLVSLTGVHYSIYTAIGYIISILFSFYMNNRFTFRENGGEIKRLLFKFLCVTVSLMLIVQLIQYIFIDVIGTMEIIGIIAGMLFYTVTGYLLNRNFVFRRKEKSNGESYET